MTLFNGLHENEIIHLMSYKQIPCFTYYYDRQPYYFTDSNFGQYGVVGQGRYFARLLALLQNNLGKNDLE